MEPKFSLAYSQKFSSMRNSVTVSKAMLLYLYLVVSVPPSSKLEELAFWPFRNTYSACFSYSTHLQTSSSIPNLRACLSSVMKGPLNIVVYASLIGNPEIVS
jgi:hypothetical protein